MNVRALSFALALLASTALGCSSSSNATTGATPTDDAGVDSGTTRSDACILQDTKLQAALDGARKSTPNAMLAVTNDACGTTVYTSGDAKTGSASTLFHVGSMTKTFVSAAVLSLVKEGKVALDDPLSKWVTAVAHTDGVTVRMLMNHSSGIFNFTETSGFGADAQRKWAPRELVDLATQNPPYFAPGTGFHYSNTNYVLLGMIAEQASGAKLGALVRERAIAPAGLEHTFFAGEEAVPEPLTKGFIGGTDVTNAWDPSLVWAAGAMVARPADVATWFSTLYATDKVLSSDLRDLLTKDPIDGGQGLHYGLGVTILNNLSSHGAGDALGHEGDIPGFYSAGYYFVDEKTTVVAFVNKEGATADAVLFAATKVLFAK